MMVSRSISKSENQKKTISFEINFEAGRARRTKPQNGLNFILSGRRLVHPKLQGAEAVFMVISRSISKIPKFENPKHRKDQRISLKKGSRETALTSSSRDDVWCIRSSRARRLCLWWSRGRFPKFQNSKIAKFQNLKITKIENHKNRKFANTKVQKS